MKNLKLNILRGIGGIAFFGALLMFQNCSEDVSYTAQKAEVTGNEANSIGEGGGPEPVGTGGTETPSNPQGSVTRQPVVCNPLDPSQGCDSSDPTTGLRGKLYYLTVEQHAPLFQNNLRNAILQDYRTMGIQVPVEIEMSNIDVSPRSWESGFFIDSGEQVQTQEGVDLLEWFHLDMYGRISLPAGSYQLASVSDDGIRVTIDGEVVIEADGVHGPRWDCANTMISFAEMEHKNIRVEYFQGPRNEIALQLFHRPAGEFEEECGDQGGFAIVSSEAFK